MEFIFGGFVVTYNRPKVLLETIHKIFEQTFPPDFLWIIDNSENLETDDAIASLQDPRLRYYRIGYNLGPAGASAKGLELCAADGAEWIYWGDDNDPPFFEDTFERILEIRDMDPFCGVLGSVGHFFDRKKGVIKRIQSRLLEKKEIVEVDCIAGGMSMMVNSEVVRQGILPNPDLFFGFEELDFCLKASRRGFKMMVPAKLFLRLRQYHNRLEFDRPLYKKKANPVREYYSLRNLLIISDSMTLNSMKKQLIKKWIAKMIYGFRYGFGYGWINLKMITLAFWHYRKGKMGKTLDLKSE